MLPTSPEPVRNAVQAFLTSQYNKKTEKEQKQLAKAIEDGDDDKISQLNDTLAENRLKYSRERWLADAVNRMAKQLNFGTHISKGIHPDAKGDNISFNPCHQLADTLVGTHSINSKHIDANGNAAALPLASFFDFVIDDDSETDIKIRDLILTDNADFIASLADDSSTAKEYHQTFKSALQNIIKQPVTHERNKQTLWATNAYQACQVEQLHYINVIPLYPSVFTHEVYQRINDIKFSEENKTARINRFKNTDDEQKPYFNLNDLATVQLGGTKPQNVSLLTSKQGGRNYLLPSLPPPRLTKIKTFKPSKFANSIFGQSLVYKLKDELPDLFKVVNSKQNNVDIRDTRKQAIDNILNYLFLSAEDMRTSLPAGWSKEYELDICEKYWLDPQRAELKGEEDFKAQREQQDWHKHIIHRFARWLNALLKEEFQEIKNNFADPEHFEWEREIEDMKKRYERAGKGVFL